MLSRELCGRRAKAPKAMLWDLNEGKHLHNPDSGDMIMALCFSPNCYWLCHWPKHQDLERTLALIKPDAIHRSEEIEHAILKSGFSVLQKRKLQLSPEQCSDFYVDHFGKFFFPNLSAFMSSGPIIALTLARSNAVAYWRILMGPLNSPKARETHPESLRAKYGTCDLKNALHGSESFYAAEREIKFMFPNSVIEPFPSREETDEYLSKHVNPTLVRGLTQLCKHKPLNPCVWLADWLIKNCPNRPQICDGAAVEDRKKEKNT